MEKVVSNESPAQLPHALLPSLSDLEERMKTLQLTAAQENHSGDTFGQRAEWFYQKRPLLLSLLRDLYSGYVTLLDRYNRTKPFSFINQQDVERSCVDEEADSHISSDVESTLSFQQFLGTAHNISNGADEIVLQLVTKSIENDVLLNELHDKEQQCHEACKIIELLKTIVELLEVEKEMAVKENLRLGYKVSALLQENRQVAADAMFMKHEAVGLARCILRMRDDHFQRVCLLRDRIFSLETQKAKKKNKKKDEVRTKGEGNKGLNWWKKMKNMSPFVKCNLRPSSTSS